jgi:hypothetical protein
MTRIQALRRIRHLAGDSADVVFTNHAGRRMRQRRVTPLEVLEVLRKGAITEGPAPDVKGCWRCTVKRFAAGEDLSVAVAVCDMTLVVITVY